MSINVKGFKNQKNYQFFAIFGQKWHFLWDVHWKWPKTSKYGLFLRVLWKKIKKNWYVFWEPCASKCLVKFQVFVFIAKIGTKLAFFWGKMTGNHKGKDHSFHLTCWTHILAKKWLPQRGKWKKMHFSKNHQFFSYFDQPSNMAQNLGSKGFPRCPIGLGGLVKVHRKCLDGFYNI